MRSSVAKQAVERLKERLAIARHALASLEELVALPQPSRVERDAAIQRFEYSFEACWRAVQRSLLVVEGVTVGSPKACVQASREVGLLSDEQAVLDFYASTDQGPEDGLGVVDVAETRGVVRDG